MAKDTTAYVWRERKRTVFGLPWTFTVYKLTDEKLIIESGFLSKTEEEIRLYRIIDVTLRCTFGQRLLGLGTIICHSSDESMKSFEIKSIKKPRETKQLLSDLVEEQRIKNRVYNREALAVDNEENEECDCHDDDNDIEDIEE